MVTIDRKAYKKGALKNSNLLKGLGVLESSESVIDQGDASSSSTGMCFRFTTSRVTITEFYRKRHGSPDRE